ncbi:hypothetical protein AVEN_16832-1 [Araneus ventricosus]|uniref:Uncharacterized protein n=1 Tax=Araneus ventricosus TaxID=182803 RepID=A0A4Y2BQJ0_ARAVE|nr:hypothetical protein AVEN_16832-1 [Araneus ventricosus]
MSPHSPYIIQNTVVAACSDHECNDQSVVLIKTAQNRSVPKRIENPPILVINNLLVVISFDEIMPQNMRMMTRGQKRNHHQPKKFCKPHLPIVQSNTVLNLLMELSHKNGYPNECLKTKKQTGYS